LSNALINIISYAEQKNTPTALTLKCLESRHWRGYFLSVACCSCQYPCWVSVPISGCWQFCF